MQDQSPESAANAPLPTSDQTRAIWENIAAWWDQSIGEGNEFQKKLIMPATDLLLNLQPGEEIVDIACGNGNYSRKLSRQGARVTACDYCEAFLNCARQRTTPEDGHITYQRVDATSEAELLALGNNRFDAAVCSMAMMDMVTIEPLLRSIPKILKPRGRFIFSLPHPCFNGYPVKLTAALIVDGDRAEQQFGVEVRRYLTERAGKSIGIINQPEPHYFFDRPLSSIFRSCFAAGLVVDGMEEPSFVGENAKNPFSWAKRPELPPAIVIRVRAQ